jgi:hypothetical protein
MPTERELLALCLRWIQNPQGDAFDKAMLIEAVQAKLQPRPWVGLTEEERKDIREWQSIQDELGPVWAPMMLYLYMAIEAKLKEKNQ